MKCKIIKLISLIIITVICASCSSAPKAEEALCAILDGFKNGDMAVISANYETELLTQILGDESIDDVVVAFAKNMEYRIVNSEETDSKHISFEVKITSADTALAVKKYIQNVTDMVTDNGDITNIEFKQKMIKELENVLASSGAEKTEKSITIEMKKERGRWKIADPDGTLPRLLYGNLAGIVISLI